MTAAKVLLIVLGSIAVLTRGFGVLKPARARQVITGASGNAVRMMALALLVYALFVFLFVRSLAGAREVFLVVVAALCVLGGIVYFFRPAMLAQVMKAVCRDSDALTRLWSALGVLIGIALIAWGVL